MSINELRYVAPPPLNPIHNVALDYVIENNLPELPPDYLEFISVYGECSFYKHVFIMSPYRKDNFSLIEWHRHNADQLTSLFSGPLAKLNSNVLPLLPISIYPDRNLDNNGLLLCGGDYFGEHIAWIMQGPPEKWRIAYFNIDLYLFNVYDMSLTNFLLNLVRGDINPECFPEDIRSQFSDFQIVASMSM